jgi:hypothetical protein
VLSGGARKFLVFFIVFGILLIIGQSALQASRTHNTISTVNASIQVQTDVNPVSSALDNYTAHVTACKGQLTCVTGVDSKLATTLNTFARQLPAISMPTAQATADDSALSAAVSRTAAKFAKIGTATSATQYVNLVNAAGLQDSVNQINTAFTKLANDLGA